MIYPVLLKKMWISTIALGCTTCIVLIGCINERHVPSYTSPYAHLSLPTQSPVGQVADLQEMLSSSSCRLAPVPRSYKLPDLRTQLLFLGCNIRPDQQTSTSYVQFSFRGQSTIYTKKAAEPFFLQFDIASNTWSVAEIETPLSVTLTPRDTVVDVLVHLCAASGEPITTPKEYHFFWLPQSFSSYNSKPWSIGQWPVDGSFFERQQALWYGQDEMIQTLGEGSDKERVQIGTQTDAYVVWMAEKDCFIFDGFHWTPVIPGPTSLNKPLLQVQSITSSAIKVSLWNHDGSQQTTLTLGKQPCSQKKEAPPIQLLGATSKRKWTARIGTITRTIAPDDWIVVTNTGLTCIDSEQMLNNYLEGKLQGDLIAFQGFQKSDGQQVLKALFFDSTRTQKSYITTPLYRSWEGPLKSEKEEDNNTDASDEDGSITDDVTED